MACLVFTDLFTLNHCSLMFFYCFYRWHLEDVIILSRRFFKTVTLVTIENHQHSKYRIIVNGILTLLSELQVINLLKFYRYQWILKLVYCMLIKYLKYDRKCI